LKHADLASFSKLSTPSYFTLSHRLSFSYLYLSRSFSIWSFGRDTAAGDKFRIPVVLFVTVAEANLLLSFMHYRRSLPFYRPSTESGDVVLVHSYFGTNIMLIPAGAPVAHRCLSPREKRNIDVCRWLSADKDRETATHTRLTRMLSWIIPVPTTTTTTTTTAKMTLLVSYITGRYMTASSRREQAIVQDRMETCEMCLWRLPIPWMMSRWPTDHLFSLWDTRLLKEQWQFNHAGLFRRIYYLVCESLFRSPSELESRDNNHHESLRNIL